MCQIPRSIDWAYFLKEFFPACAATIVGVVVAVLGTYSLSQRERAYFKRKEALDIQERRRLVGHRSMLAMELQRCLAQEFFDRNKFESDPKKWKVFGVNRQSIPTINAGELEFLFTSAQNKNILPKLLMQQQNFDQLVDSVSNFAAVRRELETALLTGSSLQGMYQEELRDISGSILAMITTILGGYREAQTMLQTGLQESVPDFIPIYKV